MGMLFLCAAMACGESDDESGGGATSVADETGSDASTGTTGETSTGASSTDTSTTGGSDTSSMTDGEEGTEDSGETEDSGDTGQTGDSGETEDSGDTEDTGTDVTGGDTGGAEGPDAPVRVIYLGDSVTAGVGASDPALAYSTMLSTNADAAYPDFVGRDLSSIYPSLTEIVNASYGGARTSEVFELQIPDVESQLGGFPASGETVVVMTIGGNDALAVLEEGMGVLPLEQAYESMIDIVDALDAAFPDGMHLYVTDIYEATGGTGQTEDCYAGQDVSEVLAALQTYNGALADLGFERGFTVLGLYAHFTEHGVDGPGDNWFRPDCEHPNDAGHHEIRRLFYGAITGEGI